MEMNIIPILLADAYKIGHPRQYPPKTEYVYSNSTARKSRMKGVNHIVVAGIQYFIIRYLADTFDKDFFAKPKDAILDQLKIFFDEYLGKDSVDVSIYGELHDKGYLPLRIKALPEGSLCPIGVPFMTIENTDPNFFWLTNFVETLCQNVTWNIITSATIARRFKKLFMQFELDTTGDISFSPFQGHNFSMRGMSSPESSITTDLGHLMSFVGSDTLPGVIAAKEYYQADGFISCSVPATEHAVMCAGGKIDERETFRRLICDIYPSGIVSIVSDTWDLWNVLTDIAPSLKNEIEARDGKVVFRPDSGSPYHVICGYKVRDVNFDSEYVKSRIGSQAFNDKFSDVEALKCIDGRVISMDGKVLTENEILGSVRILDREFGSSLNSKGYKQLNPKVGLIYGDGITYELAERILVRLKELGYSSTNLVFGIGSYTYQYNTRDTFSIACKATWAQVDGVAHNIFKDPVTDDGTKKSACGLLAVEYGPDGDPILVQEVSREREQDGLLEVVYVDGEYKTQKFSAIRDRIDRGIRRELA